MYAVGALLWAVVIGYVTLSRVLGRVRLFGHELDLPGWRMAIVQVLLATVDVAITASIFYALLPATPRLTWPISWASMSRPTRPGSPPICRAASACSTPRSCSAWRLTLSARISSARSWCSGCSTT